MLVTRHFLNARKISEPYVSYVVKCRPIHYISQYLLLAVRPTMDISKLENSRSPQVPPPRQSYSPSGVTIIALPAVPLCPL